MIEIIDLNKSFENNHVLKGVNLKILDGETITIIGPSGIGKSVLLKHIVGLLKPDSGRVIVDGKDITRLPQIELAEIQKGFGMLFQGGALFDSLSVKENVAFGLRQIYQLDDEEIDSIVSDTLALMGLKGIEPLMPAELSGGMKKRVGLARAIATSPKYILYDEPTTGIDPVRMDSINDLIIDLQNRFKVSSIIVTHDMTTAYKVSDRLAMLYDGKIIETGSPEEIKKSSNPIVKQFITGSSKGPITMG